MMRSNKASTTAPVLPCNVDSQNSKWQACGCILCTQNVVHSLRIVSGKVQQVLKPQQAIATAKHCVGVYSVSRTLHKCVLLSGTPYRKSVLGSMPWKPVDTKQ